MPIVNVDSDDEVPRDRSRSRSRSPLARNRELEEVENLSPDSTKLAKLISKVVDSKLAPIKKNLNKLLESNSQIKDSTSQTRGGVIDLRRTTNTIEDQLKKMARADPRSSLTGAALTKMNECVFKYLKEGKKKKDLLTSVFQELHSRALVSSTDEDNVKKVAAGELKHLKSYVRGTVSDDLLMGNYVGMNKTVQYLKTHLNVTEMEESSFEFLVIMGLCIAKFENTKEVPLSDGDQRNQEAIEKSLDDFWEWIDLKYKKYGETGVSVDVKLRSIMDRYGYEKKETNRPGVSRK